MVKHLPGFFIKPKRAALAASALLTLLLAESPAQSAPLAGASPQLKAYQTAGVHRRIAAKALRERRALARHHHVRSRYAATFPRYRHAFVDYGYEGDNYYPAQPHYFSHRYNWWPPLATFRYPDGPWYAW